MKLNFKNKINLKKENSFKSIYEPKRTQSLPNLPNQGVEENGSNFSNSNDIQEININFRNIPKGTYKQKNNNNKFKWNKNNSLTFDSKLNNNYSQDSNDRNIYQNNSYNSESEQSLKNNSYIHSAIPLYDTNIYRSHKDKVFILKNKKRENKSVDITYYKPSIYINKNENNNYLRNYENKEYYTLNNSFNTPQAYNDEKIKLNNTMNFNQKKYIKRKNSISTLKSIPKPQTFRKKSFQMPINKFNEKENYLYIDELDNNENNNGGLSNQNIRYYDNKTVNNADLYKNKRKIFIKKSLLDYKNKNYSNTTYSQRYIKNIEKIGIKLSFKNKRKNDSIDLITPELFNDLKSYSSDRKQKQVILSDLDINKSSRNNNIDKNILLNQNIEKYDKMRKKYIKKLSEYLLKNKKNKIKKKNSYKGKKYDIIDIKEKIKEEKRNRSISNKFRFNKKDIIKDSPFATLIKKEDDKGGKIDFKISSVNSRNINKIYKSNTFIKEKSISQNKINHHSYSYDININKNKIILSAAKAIQRWWRNILIKFFNELNIIKIQSAFRSFLFRKKFNRIKTITKNRLYDISKIILIQRKWREFHIYLKNKKNINNSFSIQNEEKIIDKKINKYQYDNNFFGNISVNNIFIQKNNSFEIISDFKRKSYNNKNGKNYFKELINEGSDTKDYNKSKNNELYLLNKYKNETLEIKSHIDTINDEDDDNIKYIKSDYNTISSNKNISSEKMLVPIKTILHLCFFSKKRFINIGYKNIILIQRFFKKYLGNKNSNSKLSFEIDEKIKMPKLLPSFIDKIRLKRILEESKKNNNYNNKINYEIDIKIDGNKNIDEDSNNLLSSKTYKRNKFPSNALINNSIHEISFSIDKKKLNIIPHIQRCFFSKGPIVLNNRKKDQYDLVTTNNLEKYTFFNINPSSKEKDNIEYKISKNINNYIKSSKPKIQNNYNSSHNTKYSISYFSNEINGNPKRKPEYKISSINLNIDDNKKLIDEKNNKLNYLRPKKESLIKVPILLNCYITKKLNIIVNNYKHKLKAKQLKLENSMKENDEHNIYKSPLINNFCFISKIYKKENFKELTILKKFLKKRFERKKNNLNNTYIKPISLDSLITKEYKNNKLLINKIKFIQKQFRRFNENKSKPKNDLETYNSHFNYNKNNYDKINSKQNEDNPIPPNNSDKEEKIIVGDKNILNLNDKIIQSKSSLEIMKRKDSIENNTNKVISENINSKDILNYYEKKLDFNEYEENKNFIDSNLIQTCYQIKIKRSIYDDEEKLFKFFKLIKNYYGKYFYDKLKKEQNESKLKNFIKILIQRIDKFIIQNSFQKIKKCLINKNLEDSKNSNYENNDISSLKNIPGCEEEKEIFFFNTIRRHLKINRIDNNWKSDNEVIKLLKNNLPDYFKNYPKIKFIPFIGKENEKNLIENELYKYDDDKLADYIYKCYQIEKNIFTITPTIIKNRLIKSPLNNQNLFSITRYMDNLYEDFIDKKICQNCYCKNNELCLLGCKCHNKKNRAEKKFKLDLEQNYKIVNNIEKNKNIKNLKFEIIKRFSQANEHSNTSNLLNNNKIYSNINKANTVCNTSKNHIYDVENYDKKSNHSEYIKNSNNSLKINNFIKNFSLRKKNRKSISSNASNFANEIEDLKSFNNNFKENSFSNIKLNDDYEQCNIYDEDVKNSNDEEKWEEKKINNSLYKKKISPIIPLPKKTSAIIKKVNSFRYNQDQCRKKFREIIKLRDTNFNYDNEIYENV